jgi:hypothetical protein
LSHAVVGAKLPIPSVSKKLTTAPTARLSRLGTARFATADFMSTIVNIKVARTIGTSKAMSMTAPQAIDGARA